MSLRTDGECRVAVSRVCIAFAMNNLIRFKALLLPDEEFRVRLSNITLPRAGGVTVMDITTSLMRPMGKKVGASAEEVVASASPDAVTPRWPSNDPGA